MKKFFSVLLAVACVITVFFHEDVYANTVHSVNLESDIQEHTVNSFSDIKEVDITRICNAIKKGNSRIGRKTINGKKYVTFTSGTHVVNFLGTLLRTSKDYDFHSSAYLSGQFENAFNQVISQNGGQEASSWKNHHWTVKADPSGCYIVQIVQYKYEIHKSGSDQVRFTQEVVNCVEFAVAADYSVQIHNKHANFISAKPTIQVRITNTGSRGNYINAVEVQGRGTADDTTRAKWTNFVSIAYSAAQLAQKVSGTAITGGLSGILSIGSIYKDLGSLYSQFVKLNNVAQSVTYIDEQPVCAKSTSGLKKSARDFVSKHHGSGVYPYLVKQSAPYPLVRVGDKFQVDFKFDVPIKSKVSMKVNVTFFSANTKYKYSNYTLAYE